MRRQLRSHVFFLTLIFFGITSVAYAASWSGVLDPSRAIDWSQPGVTGGIPDRTTICATLNPGATAAQIDAAIASCPANEVVYLNAGTYNLTTGIDFADHSNVTLRGAGPDQTIIKFSNSYNCNGPNADVCIEGSFNWSGGPQNLTSWTAGYAKGTTQITLGSTAGLSVGQVLILDQTNDAADTGSVFVNDTTDYSSEGGSPGRTVGGVDYSQQEYKLVTAINGNTVTISPGLYMSNWRSSQSPSAWWANSDVTMSGVEDLTLDNSNSNNDTAVMFWNAYDSWMENVRSIMVQNSNDGGRNHVWFQYSARDDVVNSYFYGTRNASTLSYGVESWQSGDLLVENNIFQHIVSPLLVGNTEGSVFAYNYGIDDYINNTTWNMPGPSFTHDGGVSLNLFEGNEGTGMVEDNIHGTHNLDTYFRNLWTVRDSTDGSKTQQTVAVEIAPYARFMNIIGNVMGDAGYSNAYQTVSPSQTDCDTSIYLLNWTGSCGATGDPLVVSTLMRWGNYDTVNNSVQWNASEVPSGLSQYANPVPSTETLPPSFFLSAVPSWWSTPWGTPPWPAIGPDVTGGNVTSGSGTGSTLGGHAYMIPARLCYNNSVADTNYPVDTSGLRPLVFNANNCYLSGPPDTTPPSVPTNLVATAISSSQINLTWTASTDNVAVASYKIFRGGTQVGTSNTNSYSDTGLSASTNYSYTVEAVDTSGNVSGQSTSASATTLTPDTIPPTVSLTAPTNGATVSSTVTLSANASDNVAVASVSFSVDGTVVSTDTSAPYNFSWNSASVSNGSHTVTATATDTSGNRATSGSVTITVSNPVSVKVLFDAVGPSSVGASCSSCSSLSWNHVVTSAGSNTLLVVDVSVGGPNGSANQTATASYNGVAMTLAGNTNNDSATDGKAFLFYLANPPAGTHAVQVTLSKNGTTLIGGSMSFTNVNQSTPLRNVTSATGNSGAATVAVTSAVNDMVVDVISDGSGGESSNQTLRWEEDVNGGTGGSNGAGSTAAGASSVTMGYTVTADEWGIIGADIVAASAPSDTTPPTTSITSPTNNATVSGTTTVSASASDNVGIASVQLYLDGSLLGTDTTSPYSFSWNTASSTNGTHTLQTKAYDAAGNIGTSTIISVTVSNTGVTKPSITSVLTAAGTVGSAFSYQISASNSPTSYSASGLPSGLSVNTSSGLISGTPTAAGTSNVTISATNSGGTGSATLVLTISNASDTTPPTVPTNLSITGTTTSTASLSWSVSTDPTVNGQTTSGLAGYKIYRGGVQVGTSVANSYVDTGLAASTTYSYTVAAYDNAGNVSAQSLSVNAKTTGIPDTTPPTTSITSPANNATISGAITVSATASDNVGVTSVALYVDGILSSSDTTSPYTFSLNTDSLSNGSHTLQAKAYDAAGNVGTSATVTVTVSNAPQTLTASLSASSLAGIAPLSVSLTATAGGTAQGTLNYIFYCNRPDTGTNITSPADLTLNAVTSTTYTATNLCSYQTAGIDVAKVIIERGSAPVAQAQQTITVTNPITSTSTPSSTPLISSVTVGEITQTSAQVTITTAATSSVVVNYGTSQAYGNATLASPELSTIFVNLPNLTENTQYNFDVTAIAQGTTTPITSGNFTFTTQATQSSGGGGGGGSSGGGGGSSGGGGGGGGGGYTPPFTVTMSVTTSTPTTMKVTVTNSVPATTQLFYGTSPFYGSSTMPTVPLATAYFNLTSLIPNATYYLKAVSLADGTTISESLTFIPGVRIPLPPPNSSVPTSTPNLPPFTRNLTIGSTGSDVNELQTLLVQWGYLKATPTGYFGLLTEAAVAKFQAAEDISPASGYVGPLTRVKLNSLIGEAGATGTVATPTPSTPTASGSITENLSLGSSGAQVTLLQQVLFKDGDYPQDIISGYYGSLTEQAVEAFQAKYGIVSYGTPGTTGYGAVGPKTRGEMDGI